LTDYDITAQRQFVSYDKVQNEDLQHVMNCTKV